VAQTAERLILDPPAVAAAGRVALDVTPWIKVEGTDWGDATIQAIMADRDRGSFPVDYTVPNREINVPLMFANTIGGTTTAQAHAQMQAKIALFQKEGGTLARVLNTGGTVYADVVDAATHGMTSVSGWESSQNFDLDSSISLTCLPDFYQDEITLADHTETTNAELIFTETNIAGDYPARVRIVVDDDQAQDQRGLIAAFRSRYYDSASTAALKYEAESLTPLDTAARAALSGASGGTVVTHGTLSTNWTPVLGTNQGTTTFLTHKGTYRLWGRVYSTSGTTVQARAVWDVGDLVNPAENDAWRLPGASNFYDHDFGELRLDAPPVGAYRWQGQIQAKGDVGGENFSVDKVWLAPVDEGYAVLTASVPTTQGLATYSARSEFNTESGVITADSLAVGGVWTVVTNSDTDDFSAAGGVATRTSLNDSGTGTGVIVGRGVTAGTGTSTLITVQIDMQFSAAVSAGLNLIQGGVLARVTDANNHLSAVIQQTSTGANLAVTKAVASVTTNLGSFTISGFSLNTYYTVRLFIDAGGNYTATVSKRGGLPLATVMGTDTALATSGALASGKVGMVDYAGNVAANTRTYDNFAAWVPTPDAVTFASRSTQLTTDGHYRLDSGGTAYGPVSVPDGDNLRLPVAGLEGRTTEVFLKNSRGDFDRFPDPHTSTDYGDDISARVFYRPCYLNVGTI
jgi:hypothetical protein